LFGLVAALGLILYLQTPGETPRHVLHLASEALQLGQSEKAMQLTDKSIQVAGGQFTEGQLFKCRLLLDSGEVETAQALFAEIRDWPEDEKENWQIQLQAFVEAEYLLGYHKKVLEHCALYAKLAPQEPTPWLIQASIHHEGEKAAPALSAYQEGLDRDPPDTEKARVSFQMAELLLLQGEPVKARQRLESLTGEQKADPDFQLLIARSFYEQQRFEEALAVLNSLLRKSRGYPGAVLYRGMIALEQDNVEQALPDLIAAVESRPHDPLGRQKLGQAYAKKGNEAMSKEHLDAFDRLTKLQTQARKLESQLFDDPSNKELREQLAEIADQQGKLDRARYWRNTINQIN